MNGRTTTGSKVKVTAQARTKNFVVVLLSTTCERAVSRRRDLPNFKALFLIKRCVFFVFFFSLWPVGVLIRFFG